MATERLYLADARLLEFEAEVLAVRAHEGRPAVVLDRTAFYPEGGGQPADRGALAGVPVLDVQEAERLAAALALALARLAPEA